MSAGARTTLRSVWNGNSSNQDCKALQRVVRLAERISGSTLPSLQDIYLKRCKSRATKIIKDSNHPGNHLFRLLPSGKRFRSMMAKTERLRRSLKDWGGASSLRPSGSLTGPCRDLWRGRCSKYKRGTWNKALNRAVQCIVTHSLLICVLMRMLLYWYSSKCHDAVLKKKQNRKDHFKFKS